MERTRENRLRAGTRFLALLLAVPLAGCGGDSDPTDPGGETAVSSVAVTAEVNPVSLPGTVRVTASVNPAGAPQAVTWASSDPSVATVDGTGLVTTLLTGSAVITATSVSNPAVSGSVTIGIECPEPRRVTTNVTGDDTWENWVPDPVCFDYVVETALLTSSGTLVIEPGTVVGFEEDVGLRVMSAAGLVAAGTEEEPIVLTGTRAQRGFWRGVSLEGRTFPEHVITHTTIEHTGGASISNTEDASLIVMPEVTVRLEHNTLRHAEGYGLFLASGAEVEGAGENVLTSNSLGAAYVHASEAEHLKPGGDLLLGNDVDVVVVAPNRIDNEATWPRATYRVRRVGGGQDFNVFGVLTLTPGTEIHIEGDQAVLVHSGGGLSAVGTAENPILMTGTEGVPGEWRGLAFFGSSHPANALEHVTIEFGGGAIIGGGESEHANLVLLPAGTGTFGRVRIVNSTFRGSEHFGLYAHRSSELVDFTGNAFTGNAAGPASMNAPVVADIMPGNDFTGNPVDEIKVHGGTNMGLVEPTTWIDPGVPYHIVQSNSALWIISGQPFTLEPGVEMLFGPGVGLSFTDGASFTAQGTEQNRITLRAKSTRWKGIEFHGATGSLDYLDILNGGSSPWGAGSEAGGITLRVGFMSASSIVTISPNVTVSGSGFGVVFSLGPTLVLGACPPPIHVPPPAEISDHCPG